MIIYSASAGTLSWYYRRLHAAGYRSFCVKALYKKGNLTPTLGKLLRATVAAAALAQLRLGC